MTTIAEPQLSVHSSQRQPSAIRVASIAFAARKDDTEAVNVAIGNVSLPMHPAMQKALRSLGSEEFADGVVRYTATVGTDRARAAVKRKPQLRHGDAQSLIDLDEIHVPFTRIRVCLYSPPPRRRHGWREVAHTGRGFALRRPAQAP